MNGCYCMEERNGICLLGGKTMNVEEEVVVGEGGMSQIRGKC